MRLLLAGFLVAGLFSSCLKSKDDDPPPPPPPAPGGQTEFKWDAIADSASKSLNLFWSAGGKYFTATNATNDWTNYWPNAHGLDVLVDAYLRTDKSAAVKTQMDALLEGMKAKNGNTWINHYYDDMEWMALASLRAYNATNDNKYRDIVNTLWADIKGGWSSDLGGGIWWRKDKDSKNAPSNLPAAILAARLHRQFNDAADLKWAEDIYNWMKNNLYDANTGLVYDNIAANGTKNTSWKFTYNQGTFIGAALELYKITNNANYLQDAIKAADYTLNSGFLTSNGVLKDEGGGDGGLFKGVFVRYFTRLIVDGGLEGGKKTSYVNFLTTNAKTLWTKGTNKSQVLFNSKWDAMPGSTVDFTTQASGVMLMEALAELKKVGLIN